MFALRVWVGFGASWRDKILCESYSFVNNSALGDHKYLNYIIMVYFPNMMPCVLQNMKLELSWN